MTWETLPMKALGPFLICRWGRANANLNHGGSSMLIGLIMVVAQRGYEMKVPGCMYSLMSNKVGKIIKVEIQIHVVRFDEYLQRKREGIIVVYDKLLVQSNTTSILSHRSIS